MRVSLIADAHETLQRDRFFVLRSKQMIALCRVASVRPWDVDIDRIKPNPTLIDLHDWIHHNNKCFLEYQNQNIRMIFEGSGKKFSFEITINYILTLFDSCKIRLKRLKKGIPKINCMLFLDHLNYMHGIGDTLLKGDTLRFVSQQSESVSLTDIE